MTEKLEMENGAPRPLAQPTGPYKAEPITKADEGAEPSPVLFPVIGISAGLFAANLYYAQPLITTIARDLNLKPEFAGTVVSASQLGYGLGLFLLVPLADIVENRRLVLICSILALAGIIGIATARSAMAFLCFAMIVGVFSSGTQILIPYLSHLIPDERRGRILGGIMAGILTSIMLARPTALFVAAASGWRVVYYLSAVATMLTGVALWRLMPQRHPKERTHYLRALSTMFVLFASQSDVRWRAMYQAILFATFTMFWAVVPILLAERYGLDKTAIGLFSLVGMAGAVAALLAGRIADRGGSWSGTVSASLVLAGSFLLSSWSIYMAIPVALVAASLLIDGSVQVSQMLSRVVVLDVAPEIRGRINGMYMTIVYVSGALGSVLGVSVYVTWGWHAVAALGAAGGIAVFAGLLIEKARRHTSPAEPRR